MRSTLKRLVLVCAALAFGAVAFFLVQTFRQPAPLIPPLPNPNGYDDLVKAGESIVGMMPDEASSAEALRSFLDDNTNAIALAQLGLSRPIRVPLQASPGSAINPARMGSLPALKSVARLFHAQGKLAELEGRNGEALESYLQLLELGKQTMNGGVIIDALMGLAIESMGLTALKNLHPKLSEAENARLLSTLRNVNAQNESFTIIVRREHAWAKQVFRWRYHLIKLFQPKAFSSVERTFKQKWDAHRETLAKLIHQVEHQ